MKTFSKCGRLIAFLIVITGSAVSAQVSISSFTPVLGSPGEQVRIDGSGFYPGVLAVYFNGVRDFTAAATTPSQIQARVPATATTGPITVQINGGTPASSLEDFTVIGAGPYITNFTPTVGSAGTLVTIRGVHFSSAKGAYFNNKAGNNFFVQSDNQIQVNAPAGVASGPISVRSATSTNVSSTYFYVPPVIAGFSPAGGRTGTNFIVNGTNFLGTISVTLNGTNAAFTVLSNRAVQVTVPPLATSGKLRINAPAGSATTTSNFLVKPTIYGFSPGFGPAGTSVTVTGANFNVGTPTVKFNGVNAAVSDVSFGQLMATVPASATTGRISINTTDGNHTNNTLFYLPASITSFTPTNKPPGTRVKITGKNFTGATSVLFGGVPATNFTITNNTTIGVTVPGGALSGPITVVTPAGAADSTTNYYLAPVIADFAPTHGLPGTNVLLSGINFLGATSIKFNGVNAPSFTVTNNGLVRVTVPAGAQSGPITLAAPGGTHTTVTPFIMDYVDLAVSAQAGPVPVFVGSNLVYSLTVTNRGPVAAADVKLTNALPAGVPLRAVELSQGTLHTNTSPVWADLESMSVGETRLLSFTITPGNVGWITNTATVSSSYIDTVATNNTAVTTNFALPSPLLSIRLLTNQVRVSWPLPLSNFTLQYKGLLDPANLWTNLTTPPVTVSNENVVLETNSQAARFYRLRE